MRSFFVSFLLVLLLGYTLYAQAAGGDLPATKVGWGLGVSEVGNSFGLLQSLFQSQEVNLSQGNMIFSESDLTLPGKNGMGVCVNRQYNSRAYASSSDSNPVRNQKWGAWAGHGWSFSFGMRVFVVLARDRTQQKIVLESSDGMEELVYHNSQGCFLSKSPGKRTKAYLDTYSESTVLRVGTIRIQTDTGVEYRFSRLFYDEYFQDNQARDVMHIYGLYLTSAADLYGNTLTYEYVNYRASENAETKKLSHIELVP